MNIIFVCHGNICRSVAAEFIMKNFIKNHNIISRAVSYEEIGNDTYPPMKHALVYGGFSIYPHSAQIITSQDLSWADVVYYMDQFNYNRLIKMFGENDKFKPIFLYTPGIIEIEDPWYTGNYNKVVEQITRCIQDIIKNLRFLKK